MMRSTEGSIDLFGTYATRDRFGNGEDGWGGGIGLNYFLTRYVGIGADSYIEEWKVPYRVNGSLLIRLPIDPVGLAPYVFGGGGREWNEPSAPPAIIVGGLSCATTNRGSRFDADAC